MMMMLLLIIIIIWAPPRAQSPACRRVGGRRRPPLKLLPVPNERERKPERITEEAGSAGISSAPALAARSLRPPLPQPRAAHQGSRPLPEGLQISFFFLSTTSPHPGGRNPGSAISAPPPPWLLCVVVLDRASVEESFSNVTAGDGSGPAPRSPRRAPGAGRSGGEWPQLRPRPHGAGDWNPSGGKAAARLFSDRGRGPACLRVRALCSQARGHPGGAGRVAPGQAGR